MNRRGMIRAVVALVAANPGFAWVSPTAAKEVREPNLPAFRNLLLPALRGFNGKNPDLEFDLQVSPFAKSLLVVGYNSANKNVLGFALTKQTLLDKSFVGTFYPDCEALAEALRSDAPTLPIPLNRGT